MDKIEKIRQEIGRLKRLLNDSNYYLDNSEQAVGYGSALDDLNEFVGNLSEEPDKGLEAAARRYAIPTYMKDVDENFLDEYPYDPVAERAFIAGAEWQKKRFEAEYELDWLTDLKKDLYELGRKDEREQMMKEAVECVVCAGMEGDKWIMTYIGDYESMLKTCKAGDKVRIIVLKAEEE